MTRRRGTRSVDAGGVEVVGGDRVDRRQQDHHVEPREHPRGDQDQGRERGCGAREPRLSVVAQADGAEDQVCHAPVVVVNPEPDHADDRVGHENGREPDGPEDLREGHARVEDQREPQRERNVDDGCHQSPGQRVRRRLPEDLVAREDLAEVVQPDELVQHPEVHAEAVDAVVEGHEDRVDGEREVEEQRRAEKDGDGAPRAPGSRAAGGDTRDDSGKRAHAAGGISAHGAPPALHYVG